MRTIGEILQERYSDDKDLTVYRPELRTIAKSMGSTILLSQMLYWDKMMKRKGKQSFYKFKLPCNHPKYKEGQSWCEELNISREEFDSALKNIACKRPKKSLPQDTAEMQEALIWYHTDMSRLTYYEINTKALHKALEFIHTKNTETAVNTDTLRKAGTTLYVKREPHVSIYTENTNREYNLNLFAKAKRPRKLGRESFNGLLCKVCNEPQFETPSGICCINGHGGEEGINPKDLAPQNNVLPKTLKKIKIAPKIPGLEIYDYTPEAKQILQAWYDSGGKLHINGNTKGAPMIQQMIDSLLIEGWNPYSRLVDTEIATKKWTPQEIVSCIKFHVQKLKKDITKDYFSRFVVFEQRGYGNRSKADYSPLVTAFETMPKKSEWAEILQRKFTEAFPTLDLYPIVYQNIAKFLESKVDDYRISDAGNNSFLPLMFFNYMKQKVIVSGKVEDLKYMSGDKNMDDFFDSKIKSFKVVKRTKEEKELWIKEKPIREENARKATEQRNANWEKHNLYLNSEGKVVKKGS